MRLWAAVMALLTVSACTPQADPDAQALADGVVPLQIVTATGTHDYRVEVARTGAEQARGLMYRQDMAPDAGMIFPFDRPRPASFWMQNTYLSLDMIFFTPDFRVESVAANTTPLTTQTYNSQGIVGGVLELNAGEAARIGLRPGDQIVIDLGE